MFYPFPLVAEAEGANRPRLFPVGGLHLLVDGTQARLLAVLPRVPDHQHVGQVGDVAGRQAQRLDLGELPVHGLRGDESPQGREGRVHVLGAVSLARVGGVPLAHHAAALLQVAPPCSPAPPVAELRAHVALAAVALVVVVVVGHQV